MRVCRLAGRDVMSGRARRRDFIASSHAVRRRTDRGGGYDERCRKPGKAVGGDLVQVKTIIPPTIDPEAFEPRASDFATLADARAYRSRRPGLRLLDRQAHGSTAAARASAGRCTLDRCSAGVPLLEVRRPRPARSGRRSWPRHCQSRITGLILTM